MAEVDDLLAWFKVRNLKELRQGIVGLQERVRFTEGFETLRFENERLRARLALFVKCDAAFPVSECNGNAAGEQSD